MKKLLAVVGALSFCGIAEAQLPFPTNYLLNVTQVPSTGEPIIGEFALAFADIRNFLDILKSPTQPFDNPDLYNTVWYTPSHIQIEVDDNGVPESRIFPYVDANGKTGLQVMLHLETGIAPEGLQTLRTQYSKAQYFRPMPGRSSQFVFQSAARVGVGEGSNVYKISAENVLLQPYTSYMVDFFLTPDVGINAFRCLLDRLDEIPSDVREQNQLSETNLLIGSLHLTYSVMDQVKVAELFEAGSPLNTTTLQSTKVDIGHDVSIPTRGDGIGDPIQANAFDVVNKELQTAIRQYSSACNEAINSKPENRHPAYQRVDTLARSH